MTMRIALTASLALLSAPAMAQPLIWGVQVEQAERRFGDADGAAWKLDAMIGTDALKLRYLSEGEYTDGAGLERFETQLLLQVPVSDFFDAKSGLRYDAPRGPDRAYATVGVQGLAKQWVEVDLDLFLSEKGAASLRLDAEYEALITNRIILTPSVEIDLPFADDREIGIAAWGPTVEIGARLSYDLVDRAFSPYLGVHYERAFGAAAALRRDEGEATDALHMVIGARMMF